MMTRVYFLCAALTALAVSFSARAEFTATLGAGFEYDSNVEVEAAETNAGLGDTGRTLDVELGLKQRLSGHWQMSGAYLFNDTRWQRYSTYNTQLHTGMLQLRGSHGALTTELTGVYAAAYLTEQDFLQLRRISPALGWMPDRHWYLRSQLDAGRKTFNDYSGRDSDSLGLRLQFFRFFNRSAFYLTGGGQWKQETADDPQYSYRAGIGRLALKRDWTLAGHELSSRLFLRVEHREYLSTWTDLDAARDDWRLRAGLSNRLMLGAGWSLALKLQNDDFRSNLSAADYSQYRVDAGVQWQF